MSVPSYMIGAERRPWPSTIRQVQRVVALYYGVRLSEMLSRQRTPLLSWPRHVAIFFTDRIFRVGAVAIGKAFDRDHGTVPHAVRHVMDVRQTEPEVRADLQYLAELLNCKDV